MDRFLKKAISKLSNVPEEAALLIRLVPSLTAEFLLDTSRILDNYMYTEEYSLLKQLNEYKKGEEANRSAFYTENVTETTISYLRTLYNVVISIPEDSLTTATSTLELQQRLLACHCSRNPEIAKLASKTMGVLVKSTGKLDVTLFKLWWECIELCLSSSEFGVDPENGYLLWLRCISADILVDSLSQLQELFTTEAYWDYLQSGILTKTYEIRKYALYILSQSLLKVQNDLRLAAMKWEIAKRDIYIWEWQKYTTLVNIISIDTSLHQAEDSANDLIKIIGKNSLIPKSWARCLLSTGLQSSMDSLRKFIGNVLMEVTSEDLEIIASDFSFLTDILLPHLMVAHNFSVEKSEKASGQEVCMFGDRLADFIAALFAYLPDASSRDASNALLSFLYKQRHSFDPARIYVMYGIESGLHGRKILSTDELSLTKSLFSSSTETKLRERAIFSLYYRILLSVDDSQVEFMEWFRLFCDVSNSFTYLYLDLVDQVVDFLKSSSYLQELSAFADAISLENANTFYPIFMDLSDRLGIASKDALVAEMPLDQILELSSFNMPSVTKDLVKPGNQKILTTQLQTLFLEALSSNGNEHILIMAAKACASNQSIFKTEEYLPTGNDYISSLWARVQSILDLDEKFDYVLSRFSVLNLALAIKKTPSNESPISSDSVLTFLRRLIRTKAQSKELTVLKNDALAEAYGLLRKVALYDNGADHEKIFDSFIDQLETVTSQSRLNICLIAQDLIQGSSERVTKSNATLASFLKTFWDSLVADRLIATEKDLHLSFIQLAFSSEILQNAYDDSSLAETLEAIASEVVQQSYARRCLLPTLSASIYEHYSAPNVRALKWLGRVLVSIYTFVQINDNLFRLEKVVADRADQLHALRNKKKVVHSTYATEYGRNEVASKIDVIYILSSLQLDNSADAKHALYLFQFILQSPVYHIFEPIKRSDGLEEMERTRLYHVLMILSRFVETDLTLIENLTNDVLIPAITTEPSPVVRTYIEWLIARFTVSLLQNHKSSPLLPKLDNPEESPRVVASYQRICLIVARRLRQINSDRWVKYYYDYMVKIVPFATSNRAAIRHFSVSMICALSDEFDKGCDPMLNDLVFVLTSIATQAKSSENYKQFRSGENSVWGIQDDYTILGVCGGVLGKVSDRVLGEIEENDFASYPPASSLQIPLSASGSFIKWAPDTAGIVEPVKALSLQEAKPLQVKSSSWNSVIDVTVGEDGRDSDRVKRGELVVVSSLVDKPPNLGGICRLCDVLGAKELCLNDLSISRHAQFKNVAVSADRWMPMREVKESDIIKFMMEKKREGYTLIGLEQTNKSVQLNNELQFPKKSLILLGKEREGIPAEYLAELDFCVEIKQVGVIRSMNIQTATAVIVHAYSVQHC